MRLTFLEADTPLTKRFTVDDHGELIKDNYPHALNFTSHTVEVGSLKHLYTKLKPHARKFHCLLKGEIRRELNKESRAGSTSANTPTRLMLLDLDGVRGIETVDEFIRLLPNEFQNVDTIVQYSASMGLEPDKGLSAHLFFLLDKPQLPGILKDWLTHLNLNVGVLREGLTLSRTKTVLKWTLDISVCQNDKLIYIAPPILESGVEDSFRGDRIRFIEGNKRCLVPDLDPVNAEANKVAAKRILNELRKTEGLEPRNHVGEKVVKGITVARKPGEATITGIKIERGFVYFNLNGGDSWGYYHPADNFEVLYNFKGEPNYLTKELLPSYYAEKSREQFSNLSSDRSLRYLTVLDVKTSTYYRGTYDEFAGDVTIHPAKTVKILNDFMSQNGRVPPEYIDEWTVQFRFNDERRVDFDERFINLYRPSLYFRPPMRSIKRVPPKIRTILTSALGSAEAAVEHFLNWLACIVQYRIKIGTAWVLWGTQGTGKGLLFDTILTPLIGSDYVTHASLATFDKEHNGFMENNVFILVDEAEMSKLARANNTVARLKSLITEPRVDIRRMHTDLYTVENFSHFILASNKHDPIEVAPDDRRFHVAPRQENKLQITPAEVDNIHNELPDFAAYLMTRKADLNQARTPYHSEARSRLQELTRDSNETVADALRNGDFEFFFDNRPDQEDRATQQLLCGRILPTYRQAMKDVVRSSESKTIPRDSLETLFYYINDVHFKTPNKFTRFINHKGLHLIRKRHNGDMKQCFVIERDFTIPSGIKGAFEQWMKSDNDGKPRLHRIK